MELSFSQKESSSPEQSERLIKTVRHKFCSPIAHLKPEIYDKFQWHRFHLEKSKAHLFLSAIFHTALLTDKSNVYQL